MWLPETAVDLETLEVVAEEGIRFTILAPHQVAHAPAGGRPGLCRLPGGKSIALFIYRGDSSHAVAFGGALHDGIAWARALIEAARTLGAPAHATDRGPFGRPAIDALGFVGGGARVAAVHRDRW